MGNLISMIYIPTNQITMKEVMMLWTLKMMVWRKTNHRHLKRPRKQRNLEFWIRIKLQHQQKCWERYWTINRVENRNRLNGKKNEQAQRKENVLQKQKELESILISAFERNNIPIFQKKYLWSFFI